MYFVTLLIFLQIIPLYSICGERYNYFGSAFIAFGIVSLLIHFFKRKRVLQFVFLISICLLLSTRTLIRISDWKDSDNLFKSTIRTSKTLFKKGIWTYNLAISQTNEGKKAALIKESIRLLKESIKSKRKYSETTILKSYELDTDSLITKAILRIATNSEILNDRNNQIEFLLKALKLSKENSPLKALTLKNLGTFYFQEKDYTKAINYYKEGYKISPGSTWQFAIAACYLQLKDFQNYIKHLEAAIAEKPPNGEASKAYGNYLDVVKRDFSNAIKQYKIATLLLDSPEPYIFLATAYLKSNQIDNAIKAIRNGLYGFPEESTLTYLKGTILLNKGKKDEGISNLIKVVDKNDTPKDIKLEACNILAEVFSREGNLSLSKKYEEIAKRI